MIQEALTQKIQTSIQAAGYPISTIKSVQSVGGGSINQTYKLISSKEVYFVKINSATRFPGMFAAEEKGLQLLAKHSELEIPKVISHAKWHDDAFLVLEYIEPAKRSTNFWEHFGEHLAAMHRKTQSYFGLDHDNYIGSLPQSNKRHNAWAEFFVLERLEPLMKQARDENLCDYNTSRKFDTLFHKMDTLFPEEPPALLHGDLWSGNYMTGSSGYASIYDPAVYYGHREMDLGMSRLFGGFDAAFYSSYQLAYPLEKGWEERLHLANLYPLLVHLILFGTGYLYDIKRILSNYA